jgi:hypothetical protein
VGVSGTIVLGKDDGELQLSEDRAMSSTLAQPLIVFDDDHWMSLYDSVESLQDHLEFPFVDEVAAALDGNAVPLRIFAVGEEVRIEAENTRPELERLQALVDEFFSMWTDEPPPEHRSSASAYVEELASRYRAAKFRRRKRRRQP